MIEYLKDRWLTWRTGKNKSQRDWEQWYYENVVVRAHTIENMFMHFEHVILVNPKIFFDYSEPFAWVPCADARQYFYPQRKLGENCVWRFERVRKDQWDGKLHIDELGGEDRVFVATNNSKDAVMIALRWA
jgi:hypothetical protein